jgi:hypothetical protein
MSVCDLLKPGEAHAAHSRMKFLIDAHLPCRLAYLLHSLGPEAMHTLDLSLGGRTLVGFEGRPCGPSDAGGYPETHLW